MLGKLKRLFVVEDENTEKKAEKTTEQSTQKAPSAAPASSTPRPSTNPAPAPKANPNAKPSQKFVDILLKAIESNNLEGFDYLEFKNALQNLSSVDMDENTRYKSALAMATTMGKQPADIINTAQHYLNVLKKEDQQFNKALENNKSTKIGDQEKRIQDTEKSITDKVALIEKLKKEIEAEKETLTKIRNSINTEAAKVQATHDGFKAAFAAVSNQIIEDIEAIKRNS